MGATAQRGGRSARLSGRADVVRTASTLAIWIWWGWWGGTNKDRQGERGREDGGGPGKGEEVAQGCQAVERVPDKTYVVKLKSVGRNRMGRGDMLVSRGQGRPREAGTRAVAHQRRRVYETCRAVRRRRRQRVCVQRTRTSVAVGFGIGGIETQGINPVGFEAAGSRRV